MLSRLSTLQESCFLTLSFWGKGVTFGNYSTGAEPRALRLSGAGVQESEKMNLNSHVLSLPSCSFGKGSSFLD